MTPLFTTPWQTSRDGTGVLLDQLHTLTIRSAACYQLSSGYLLTGWSLLTKCVSEAKYLPPPEDALEHFYVIEKQQKQIQKFFIDALVYSEKNIPTWFGPLWKPIYTINLKCLGGCERIIGRIVYSNTWRRRKFQVMTKHFSAFASIKSLLFISFTDPGNVFCLQTGWRCHCVWKDMTTAVRQNSSERFFHESSLPRKSRFNLEVINRPVVKWHKRDGRKGKLEGGKILWELRRANVLHYFFSSQLILLNHHKLLFQFEISCLKCPHSMVCWWEKQHKLLRHLCLLVILTG